MTETKRGRRMAVGFAALAAAGVIGGVTAVSLVGGQERPAEQVRTVSDEATVTPTADATSSGASALPTTAPAATPAVEPSKTAAKTTTKARSQTVTEPDPAEPAPTTPPAPEPPAPPGNSAPSGVETPPLGDPPAAFPSMGCLPQEIGINPRCPAAAPTEG